MMISWNSRRGINKAHNWHIYLFQVWVLHKNSIFMISWFTFSFFLKDGLQVMRLRLGQPILPQLVAVDDFQLELQVCQCQLQLRVYFFQHWNYKKRKYHVKIGRTKSNSWCENFSCLLLNFRSARSFLVLWYLRPFDFINHAHWHFYSLIPLRRA